MSSSKLPPVDDCNLNDKNKRKKLQMIPAFYDQSGSLVMGPRAGTPMRLVSPAPVLVPPGPQRAPQASIYPPQPHSAQQNLYSQQNGTSVGGMKFSDLFI